MASTEARRHVEAECDVMKAMLSDLGVVAIK